MILKRLKMVNFQSHRQTVVELTPGINGIVGDSDVGKSAMLRAIRWVARNEPAGDSFWNEAGKAAGESCLVGLAFEGIGKTALELESEYTVIREKSSTINEYRVYRPGAEKPEEYTGFKRDVPSAVKELLGEKVLFGKGLEFDLNIASQMDGAFLIGGTPRDFARVLGKLTGIDAIDQAEQIAQIKIRQANGKAKTLREERDDLQSVIDAMPDLTSAAGLMDELKATEKARLALTIGQLTLDKLHDKAARLHDLSGLLSLTLDTSEAPFVALTSAYKAVSDRQGRVRQLGGILSDVVKTTTQLSMADELEENLEEQLAGYKQQVEEIINSIDTCPLSKGVFYDACKELLKT